jgi:Pyruvate phosphate dikinase, AMP/ATP-binding domain
VTLPLAPSDRTLHIYLSLAQYPILSTQIRARMRRELFARGIITPQAFEVETREKAIRSQALEGLHDPFTEEPPEIWDLRLMHVREALTDFYFAYNLPFDLFEQIVHKVLEERGAGGSDLPVSFNPELAPQNMLFEQAMLIEKMPKKERLKHEARLQEIKVVLIRTLISDQLAYVKIAKDWFTIADLNEIRTHKIGQGKIGGKSAGMILAWRILTEECDDEIRACLRLPESYYLGADVTYIFMALNGLMPWNDQKYKLEDQIYADYPHIQEEFLKGEFPEDILDRFRTVLEQVGKKPLIVRSSSLLEDNFGTSFAGKYESYFCPNQGSPEQNLHDLTNAIIRIYASLLNPDALLYRRAKGLQDYDERMAILIQVVQGEPYGRYYLPHAAGVAFSRNLYRWSPQIRREDGFLRLVWGLGTRAVDRVGNDYPRLVALSHPLLRPETSAKSIRLYSQQYVDLIDLQENVFKTVPVREILGSRYPVLRYVAQIDEGEYLVPIRIMTSAGSDRQLVITFAELLRRTPLAKRMTTILQILEKNYFSPVDTEFTLRVVDPESIKPEVEIVLLQCRPQSHLKDNEVSLPINLPEQDILFSTTCMAPEGRIDDIRYVLFVPPEGYFALPTSAARAELSRLISLMNKILKDEGFICVGPGRWGTSTPDLGVPIGYGDIYHSRALVELTGRGIGFAPEPSFGTHFFQDLIESNIYPLAIDLDDPETIFKREFFYGLPNDLAKFLPDRADMGKCLRLIRVANCRAGHHLTLVMDYQAGKSVAYLEADS